MGDFNGQKQSSLRGSKTIFFIIGESTTKSWEKSRIFSFGFPIDFLSKGQKPQQGGMEHLG